MSVAAPRGVPVASTLAALFVQAGTANAPTVALALLLVDLLALGFRATIVRTEAAVCVARHQAAAPFATSEREQDGDPV